MHRYLATALACAATFALGAIAAHNTVSAKSAMMMDGPKVIHVSTAMQGSFQQVAPGVWLKPLAGNVQGDAALVQISTVKPHRHNGTSEFIYVLSGSANLTLAGHATTVNAGDFFYIPKGTPHSLQATGGRIKLLAFESPPMAPRDMEYLNDH